MAAFHETQFPANISYGARGGPKRLTQVVTLKSGFEERNQSWQHSRRKYDASIGLRNLGDLQDVITFWEARRGQLYGFRWKDWADYQTSRGRAVPTSLDVVLGTGDGVTTTFSVVKRYADSISEYVRDITKPIASTMLAAIDAVDVSAIIVDDINGLVGFLSAPADGSSVTVGFQFDTPVRFDADDVAVSIEAFQAGTIPAIDVIEIRAKVGPNAQTSMQNAIDTVIAYGPEITTLSIDYAVNTHWSVLNG